MKTVYVIYRESGDCYLATSRSLDDREIEYWRGLGYGPIVKVTKTDDGWKAEEI